MIEINYSICGFVLHRWVVIEIKYSICGFVLIFDFSYYLDVSYIDG